MVYERRVRDETTWDIWLANGNGGDQRPAIAWPDPSHERLPRWSPDGRRFAFIAGGVAQGLGSLYVHDLDTGRTEVYVDLVDGPLTWSPDGRRLVFHSPRLTGPQPRSGAMGGGAAAPSELVAQADDALMGLYMVDLEDRTIYRLKGAAGGHSENTLLGGYSPDWYAPSPTPTATPSPTPTVTPTPTPTRRYGSGRTVFLPVALHGAIGGAGPEN